MCVYEFYTNKHSFPEFLNTFNKKQFCFIEIVKKISISFCKFNCNRYLCYLNFAAFKVFRNLIKISYLKR